MTEVISGQKTRLQTSLQTRTEKQLNEVLSDAVRQLRIDLLIPIVLNFSAFTVTPKPSS